MSDLYRSRRIVDMTPDELRQALSETIRELEKLERRGLTVEQVGTRGIERALERSRQP